MIPPEQSSLFVANMERVLDVYELSYDEDYPVVCMDDYEYIRYGMVNIFIANEPLTGNRMLEVTELKTKKDWARFVKRIADEMYPGQKR